jgi:hypothetical protein
MLPNACAVQIKGLEVALGRVEKSRKIVQIKKLTFVN